MTTPVIAQTNSFAEPVGTPCPKNRKLEQKGTFHGYEVRTFRWPDMEGCFQIRKDGKVVYSKTSVLYSIGTDIEDTKKKTKVIPGMDLTGEGRPMLVISEWTGGAHCCFNFHLFRLGDDKLLKVQTIETLDGAQSDFKDLDGDGAYEFVSQDWSYDYWKASFAESPAPSIVLKFKNGKYRLDLRLMTRPAPSKETILKLARDVRDDGEWRPGLETTDSRGIPSTLWKTMLDLIYQGHPLEAWEFFDVAWLPSKPGKDIFAREFCTRLMVSPYWKELQDLHPCKRQAADERRRESAKTLR